MLPGKPRRRMLEALLTTAAMIVLTGCGGFVPEGQPAATNGLGGTLPGATTPVPGGSGPVTSAAPVGPGGGGGPGGGSTGASSGTGGTTTNGGGSGDGATTGSGPAVTSPIEIGIQAIDNSQSSTAVGVKAQQTVGAQEAYKGIVAALNKKGGIAGRKLVPTYYVYKGTEADYTTKMQAACTTFTKDHKVPVVLTFGQKENTLDSWYQCLSDAHIPLIDGGWAATDDVGYRTWPAYFSVGSPSVNARLANTLNLGHGSGYLSRKNRLGVLVEACPSNSRAYASTVTAIAKRVGVPVEKYDMNCITGFGDADSVAQAVGAAVTTFHADGVDRVMIVSNVEDTIGLLFANAAEGQGYRPGYMLTSATLPTNFSKNWPAGQLPQFRGGGWSPILDVDSQPPMSATQKECVSLAKSGGLVPSNNTDLWTLYAVCDSIFVLRAALTTTRGHAGYDELRHAIEGLGRSFRGGVALEGALALSPSRHAAVSRGAEFSYLTTCSCFRYVSGPADVG